MIFLIGTTPNAETIWQRLKKHQAQNNTCNSTVSRTSQKYGNSVYSIEFGETSPIVTVSNQDIKGKSTEITIIFTSGQINEKRGDNARFLMTLTNHRVFIFVLPFLVILECAKDSQLSGEIPKAIPKFGVGYNFHLDGVVDCPEFLVNFDTLAGLAERHNLYLVAKQDFENFFKDKRKTRDGQNLLRRIKVIHLKGHRNLSYTVMHKVSHLSI